MATQITATLPTLDFPKEVDYPTQEDWAAFSVAAELNFGILGSGWSTQMQLWKTQANAMSTELNNSADIVQSIVNYKGDWISQGYTLGQSVSVGGIYYICKLTHATGQNPTTGGSLYWNLALGNWSLKIDKDISPYTSKTTPVDADLIPLSDSVSSFGIKKLSWANLKATLKTYFDTLYTVASSETTAGVIELATTAETQAGTDDLRAITPLKLKNSVIGLGQTLQTFTVGTQRVAGNNYTNTSGKPIWIIIGISSGAGATLSITAGGELRVYSAPDAGAATRVIVPVLNGEKYSATSVIGIINYWAEIR